MGRPPKYPPEVKARALELYQQVGGAEAARQTGLPEGTVTGWATRAGLQGPTYEARLPIIEAAKASRSLRLLELADTWLTVAELEAKDCATRRAELPVEERRTMVTIAAIATDKTLKVGGEDKPEQPTIHVDVRVPQIAELGSLAAAAMRFLPAMRDPGEPAPPREVVDVEPTEPTRLAPVEPQDEIAEAARAAQQLASLKGRAATNGGGSHYGPPASWKQQASDRQPRRFEP